jgi:uroporphyrinogen-III synthase
VRLLLTRPREDSEPLAARLAEMGHETLIEPLLIVRALENVTIDVEGVQAILLTSANGARALANRPVDRAIPVLAVGDATAEAAAAAGFTHIVSAGGRAEDLAILATSSLPPAEGAVLHVTGRHVAGDLAGRLEAAGFEVRRAVLYQAEAVQAFSELCKSALKSGSLDAALLFSPRTARVFSGLIEAEALDTAVGRLDIYALSQAVADAANGPAWRRILVAARPTQDDLLDLLPERL